MSQPHEYNGVPIERLLPAWRAQVAKLSLEANELHAENASLKAEVERLTKAGNQSIAVGAKLREMVGDHHWSMEFDRVRTDWYHASRGALSRHQDPNTPTAAV